MTDLGVGYGVKPTCWICKQGFTDIELRAIFANPHLTDGGVAHSACIGIPSAEDLDVISNEELVRRATS